MQFAFEVEGKVERAAEEAPTREPMRPAKQARNPTTDQKRVRRQQARQRKTADLNGPLVCKKCGAAATYEVQDPMAEGEGNDLWYACDTHAREQMGYYGAGIYVTPLGTSDQMKDYQYEQERAFWGEASRRTAESRWADGTCPQCGSDEVVYADNEGSDTAVASESWAECQTCDWVGSEEDVVKSAMRRKSNQGMSGDYTWGDIRRGETQWGPDTDPEDMWFLCDACGGEGPTSQSDGPCPKCGSDRVQYFNPEDEEMDSRQRLQDEYDVFGYNASRRETELLKAMAKASLPEQRALALELDNLRRQRRQRVQAAWDVDLSDSHIRDCLTPVLTHTMHTAATDWLDEVVATDLDAADDGDVHQAMVAQASLWFRKTSAEVKADREEFGEQAQGMARRLAGQYGTRAAMARQAFLDHVAHLHRVAESGSELKADPSGQGHSGLPDEVPLAGHEDTFDADFWITDRSAEVPSDRAPVIQENKQGRRVVAGPACKKCGAPTGAPQMPEGDESSGSDAGGPIYVCDNGHRLRYRKTPQGKWSVRVLAESEGQTCSQCGDSIAQDPAGEEPRTWHHTNGEKHDHEAQPGGGESKESRRKLAGEVPEQFKKKDEGGGEDSGESEDGEEGGEGEGLTDEEKAEIEQLRQQQYNGGGEQAPPDEEKKEGRFALGGEWGVYNPTPEQEKKDLAEIDRDMKRRKKQYEKAVADPQAHWEEQKRREYRRRTAEADSWPLDPNDDEKSNTDEWPGEQQSTGDSQDWSEFPEVKGMRREARALSDIASEIISDWKKPYFGAVPYIDAMLSLDTINDRYGADDARYIVSYFLSNAAQWRGETAKRVKAELKSMLGRRGSKTASDPIADESGQGRSGLDDVEVGDEHDRPMWPWELETQERGAADVANVPTPGGESGYPQPKKSRRVVAEEEKKERKGVWPPKEEDEWYSAEEQDEDIAQYEEDMKRKKKSVFQARVQASLQGGMRPFEFEAQSTADYERVWREAAAAASKAYEDAVPERVGWSDTQSGTLWDNAGRGYEMQGYATVTFRPANGPFGRWLRNRGLKKAYQGGVYIAAPGQSYERRYAWARAFAEVINNANLGVRAYAEARLD